MDMSYDQYGQTNVVLKVNIITINLSGTKSNKNVWLHSLSRGYYERNETIMQNISVIYQVSSTGLY